MTPADKKAIPEEEDIFLTQEERILLREAEEEYKRGNTTSLEALKEKFRDELQD